MVRIFNFVFMNLSTPAPSLLSDNTHRSIETRKEGVVKVCAYLIAGQVAEDVVGGDANDDLVDGEEGRVAQAVQSSVGPIVF